MGCRGSEVRILSPRPNPRTPLRNFTLTRLVDDLLDVSRVTRGKLRLRSAPADLNTTVQRAIESSRPPI